MSAKTTYYSPQDIEDLSRCLSIIVTNAKLIPDPAMDGATDTYSVPLEDIADAGELIERLTALQINDTPTKRVIDGCQHSKSRMVEWVDEGACPVCLTADCGMKKEAVRDLLAALKAILNIDNPPADQPGHINLGDAAEMGRKAVQRAEGKE